MLSGSRSIYALHCLAASCKEELLVGAHAHFERTLALALLAS